MGTMMGAGIGFFMIIAGALLLVSRKKGVAAYRWACAFLALSFVDASALHMTVAVILFVSSFGLRTNVVPEKVPGWLRKPAWTLAALGFMAINVVDQLIILISDFKMGSLSTLLAQAALILLLLAIEPQAPCKRQAKPRLQSVPSEGSKLFSVASALLLCYVVFDFVLGVKAAAGAAATVPFSTAMNMLFARDAVVLLSVLVSFIPDLVACGLLLSANARKKHYGFALFCLFINRLGILEIADLGSNMGDAATAAALSILTSTILFLMVISAGGFTWNKKLFHKVPVLNFVALIMAAFALLSGVFGSLGACKEVAASTKENIYNQVKGSYSSAVYEEAYDRRDSGDVCNPLTDEVYTELYEAIYQPAYDEVYDIRYKEAYDRYYGYVQYQTPPDLNYVKSNAERVAAGDAENVASNIAENYSSMIAYDMSYEVYETIVENVAVILSEEIAVAEVYDGEKPEDMTDGYSTVIYDTREAAKDAVKHHEDAANDMVYDGDLYVKAAATVDVGTLCNTAFDKIYTRIYNEIYQPCVDAGTEAAYSVLEERKGDVTSAVCSVLFPILCEILFTATLLLMNLSLTVQEAAPVPRWFKRVLDWCYTNVGEKMQKCMKLLGAVNLIAGVFALAALYAAVIIFFRGEFMMALACLAGGVGALIIVALSIIMTYPMFSFAQLTADIHHIRNHGGMAAAPVQQESVKVESVVKAEPVCAAAPVAAPVESAPAAPVAAPAGDGEEEFDDLPDL